MAFEVATYGIATARQAREREGIRLQLLAVPFQPVLPLPVGGVAQQLGGKSVRACTRARGRVQPCRNTPGPVKKPYEFIGFSIIMFKNYRNSWSASTVSPTSPAARPGRRRGWRIPIPGQRLRRVRRRRPSPGAGQKVIGTTADAE